MQMKLRSEHPQPQFERDAWLNLNGEWDFEFDDYRVGLKEKWFSSVRRFSKKIQVPFAYQSQLSDIADIEFHDVVWYLKTFVLTEIFSGKRTMLNFGAVDYQADVWVNGHHVVSHEGGHTPFKVDITNNIAAGENTIVVRAEDYCTDITLPRGKQYWKEKPEEIWYTNTTGIWQTVWLEATDEKYIEKVKFTPFVDSTEIEIQYFIGGYKTSDILTMKTVITFDGNVVIEDTCRIYAKTGTRRIKLHEFNEHHLAHLWTPEKPFLYDVRLTLLSESNTLDDVKSYFGMRKVSVENGKFFLNNRPYYMKLVLDQGYFPDGNLTPSSDEAIKKDIELMKVMGFNGARKHQKVEDPRYLYWCDKLGLIVWGEMANALDFSTDGAKKIVKEWQEVIERDYNHPCIFVWVPMNESWGIPKVLTDVQQQHHAMALYYITKSLDTTRLVVSNDGWEMVTTDLCNIHDYEWKEEILQERYSCIEKALTALNTKFRARKVYANGYDYTNEPIIISEFGGIAFKKSEQIGWGYSGAVDEEDFINKFKAVVEPLKRSPVIQGFCYTQLTDVMQEINGLLTFERIPKVDVEKIRKVLEG